MAVWGQGMFIRFVPKWLIALAVQAVVIALVSLVVALAPITFPAAAWLRAALSWGLMPIAGGVSAYLATRKGLNNYAAWVAPPVLYAAMPWLVIGYPPDAAPMFVCALASIICAAAGDVKNRQSSS